MTAPTPQVSVVMIFRDPGSFFAEAVNSVLSQTWPAVELLLVDDASTDGSASYAATVAEAHDQVVHLPSASRLGVGTGPSRRRGIEAAGGEYVAFLDADDAWGPDHLRHEMSLLLSHPRAGMVCGRSVLWRSWRDGGEDTLSPLPFAPGSVVDPPRLLRAVLRHGGVATPTCSLLAERGLLSTALEHLTGFADAYEDQVINTVLQLSATAVVSGATDAWYRQHQDSLSVLLARQGVDAAHGLTDRRRTFLAWVALVVDEFGVRDEDLARLLRSELSAQAPRRSSTARLVEAAARRALGRRLVRLPRARRVHEDQHLDRMLHTWGEDLTGRVGALGGRALAVTARHAAAVQPLGAGSVVDCAVVGAEVQRVRGVAAALGSALRTVAPGGTLLGVLPFGADPDQIRPSLTDAVPPSLVEIAEVQREPTVHTVRVLRPAEPES